MDDIRKMREHIIAMQRWSSQNQQSNEKLIYLLFQVRTELEQKMLTNRK
jgi:hypothetical protein